jgi:DNA-binding NtrC family response regulator
MVAGLLSSGGCGVQVDPGDATPIGACTVPASHREAAAAVDVSSTRPLLVPRRRDRRDGLLDVLARLTRFLDQEQDIALMRGTFEEALGRVVPLRAIQLREMSSRWAGRLEGQSIESIALEVPGRNSATRGLLEAAFDPGSRLGEWDFQVLGAAAHLGALVLEIERCRTQLARAGLLDGHRRHRYGSSAPLIGSTDIMKSLCSTIERVASTDFTVLLEGETGVGKELVARQIHEQSRRRNGPFVAINCAALVETLLEAELFGIEDRTATGVRGRRGKFEHADGGTLFLDEVSDLSRAAQAKLLRAIQDLAVQRVGGRATHRLDIRIIAATNHRLAELVEREMFRPDLYYRLSGVDIRVPTLRERRADIIELANYFLDRYRAARTLRLSAAATDVIVTYDWPGNVRELERTIERAVTLAEGDVIALDDLPAPVRGAYSSALGPSLTHNDTLRTWASRYARLMVHRCHGNKRAACRALGISYHTLQAYLRAPLAEDRCEEGVPAVQVDADESTQEEPAEAPP